ncbi:uncharacterized protein Dwil_GK15852 [Drosophila willistoni]|uniref:U3 small nucleolar RNA-associated protein 25 homolog n=1 Tax=Drosophila willistoni TaxID=7260 RepID=B4MRN3_DROWI|nr:uncharacterized protein Dwil_GK15852 [Drosophila willistoni]
MKKKQPYGKKRGQPYEKKPPVRRNDQFSKNNSFIQRSKQMEESHRKGRLLNAKYTSSSNGTEIEAALSLLPSVQDDVAESETGFYEQLVTGYNHITVPERNLLQTDSKDNDNLIVPSSDGNSDNDEEDPHAEEINMDSDIYNSFSKRFNFELSSEDIDKLMTKNVKLIKTNWSEIGNLKIEIPQLNSDTESSDYPPPHKITTRSELQSLEVKQSLCANVKLPLSALQSNLFNIANRYQDLYYTQRSHENSEEIRFVYCLHALNHMLKSRSLILRNNEKVAALAKSLKLPPSEVSIPEIYRDQGLKRMKVLFVVPFRESALAIVNNLADLLYGQQDEQKRKASIAKYDRFLEDYSGNTIYFPKTNPKPFDYEQTFKGNTDDNFRLGIRFSKKSMSLFADISSSDVLIASPLGLRMLITDKEHDFDFLTSIELLIIDQAELFMAQNWENLLYTLDHLHLQPKKLPDTNCQRVRTWCLSGSSRFYRQTLFFSSHELPEFRAVLSNKCKNYQGIVRITNIIQHGDIRNVLTPIQQVFRRITCSDMESAFDDRFQYFKQHIMPQLSKSGNSHCMLYVPSYFDYVRLRNYLKNEMVSFVQISEYTKKEKISRARDIFFHSGAPILLYSERAHFFRRTRVKGIRNLIMYQPPNFPNFYSELINLMLESNQNPRDGMADSMSIQILYTKYDLLTLSNIVGSENSVRLTTGKKNAYVLSTANVK